MTGRYSLASSTWGQEEIAAINEVVASGSFTMGQKVAKFEEEFSALVGSKYAVMVNSGSSANLALLAALRYRNTPLLHPDDEIIVPAVSWSTTYYPVGQLGCKLTFVDVDKDSLNIDPIAIERAITSKTKAIFVVNLLGNPADWIRIREIAENHNLILIEDNCESLGAELEGKSCGTFGIGGTFSTFFSHHISTMEGGVVATNDESLFHTLKSIRAHGWTRDLPDKNHVFNKTGSEWDDLFRFVLPGYNLRPLEIEAAIGSAQLTKLPNFIENRRLNAGKFLSQLSGIEGLRVQQENGKSSWFGFSIILEGKLKGRRRNLVELLNNAQIDSRPIVTGNFTRNPVIKHMNCTPIGPLPVADQIHEDGLFVGNHHFDLTDEVELLGQVLLDFQKGSK
jgi:CDP-6-deoxy-D-xylo-4-hexulose-3-dehydrase